MKEVIDLMNDNSSDHKRSRLILNTVFTDLSDATALVVTNIQIVFIQTRN